MTVRQKACFAAGCFWGVEYVFSKFPGIVKIKAGYMGGHLKNPSYAEVCSSNTGHAESVYIEFNPKIISYAKLLDIFFRCHDPSLLNRQGPDIGTQYRSVIFYYNEKQRADAEAARKAYQKILKKKIVTSIEKASEFYDAEIFHQKYHEKKGTLPYCHIVPIINP